MKSQNLISAQEFNSIPDLHDQPPFPSDPTIFEALGDLFCRHNVLERFGLHLLHRHYHLPENCIAFKSEVDGDISLTKIEPISGLDRNEIRGVLYRLKDDGCFQPYEFEYGEEVDIPSTFLKELSQTLREYKLERLLALDVTGGRSPTITQYEYDYGKTATITVNLNRTPIESEDRQTGLAFVMEGDAPRSYGPNIYAKNVRDTHNVFYNHNMQIIDDSNFEIDRSAIRGILVLNGILAY